MLQWPLLMLVAFFLKCESVGWNDRHEEVMMHVCQEGVTALVNNS